MIKIQVKIVKSVIKYVHITGHGGGIKGKDIICASVSAIAHTALAGLIFYGKDSITWKKSVGNLTIELKEGINKSNEKSLHVILNTMLLGLKGIEKEYPDRIKIEIKN